MATYHRAIKVTVDGPREPRREYKHALTHAHTHMHAADAPGVHYSDAAIDRNPVNNTTATGTTTKLNHCAQHPACIIQM